MANVDVVFVAPISGLEVSYDESGNAIYAAAPQLGGEESMDEALAAYWITQGMVEEKEN
mgnify:CR=1 FL=1